MSFISSGCSHEKTLQVRGSPSFPNGGETALVLADRDAVDGKAYSRLYPDSDDSGSGGLIDSWCH